MPKLRVVQAQPKNDLARLLKPPSQLPKPLTSISCQNTGPIVSRDVLDPIDDRFPLQEKVEALIFWTRVPIRRTVPDV